MSAETLREAARVIRLNHDDEFFVAVADLLDRAADDHDETPCPAVDNALAVAVAYLGEA